MVAASTAADTPASQGELQALAPADVAEWLEVLPSGHLQRPALAAAREVLAMGNQALVQLAGEHRDAVHSGMVPKPVAGHADHAAASPEKRVGVEVRPLLDWGFESGRQSRRPGKGNAHEHP